MWIFAASVIEPAMAALLIIGLMLWTGVLGGTILLATNQPGTGFFWFATLVALANGLSTTGFIAWLGKEGGVLMSGVSPTAATHSDCGRVLPAALSVCQLYCTYHGVVACGADYRIHNSGC